MFELDVKTMIEKKKEEEDQPQEFILDWKFIDKFPHENWILFVVFELIKIFLQKIKCLHYYSEQIF